MQCLLGLASINTWLLLLFHVLHAIYLACKCNKTSQKNMATLHCNPILKNQPPAARLAQRATIAVSQRAVKARVRVAEYHARPVAITPEATRKYLFFIRSGIGGL